MIKREIRWRSGEIIDDSIIINQERLWNIKYPKQYIDIVLKNDGSRPQVKNDNGEWKSGRVNIPKWQPVGFRFISLKNSEFSGEPKVVFTYKAFKECLPEPEKIFPFGDDGGGNILFFDYRKNSNEPAIVFLDHERAITEEDIPEEDLKKKPLKEWLDASLYPVCNSFAELLDLIEPSN